MIDTSIPAVCCTRLAPARRAPKNAAEKMVPTGSERASSATAIAS
jgi:hypothetical protein